MANVSKTKNILLLGGVNHGKTTFKKAIKTVLQTRYGIGQDSTERFGDAAPYLKENPPFEFILNDCCYRILHLPAQVHYQMFFPEHGDEIDAAILICSYFGFINSDIREQLQCCSEHGINLIGTYIPCPEHMDIELLDIVRMEILDELEGYDTDLVLHGNSVHAIANPYGPNADTLIQFIFHIVQSFA